MCFGYGKRDHHIYWRHCAEMFSLFIHMADDNFRVQTSAYSAEFGNNMGAVVNVTLKSGTNHLRGTLFEFVRNDVEHATHLVGQHEGHGRRVHGRHARTVMAHTGAASRNGDVAHRPPHPSGA